jgi:hypothetical protein
MLNFYHRQAAQPASLPHPGAKMTKSQPEQRRFFFWTVRARFAAFVQHAWNPERKRFRNFMSFDRHWTEEVGSEDSHGRALWALGECARDAAATSRRKWAASLFVAALPAVQPSPRHVPGHSPS